MTDINTTDIEKAEKAPAVEAVGVPVLTQGDNGTSSIKKNQRESSLCCGSCCDLVRAVIVVNSIFICLQSFNLLFMPLRIFPAMSAADANSDNDLDDAILGDDEEFDEDYNGFSAIDWDREKITAMIIVGLSIPFAAMGIFGACKFKKYPVLLTALWYCFYVVRNLLDLSIFGVILFGLFAYPHIHLVVALHRGTIRKENYLETEQRCCCEQ